MAYQMDRNERVCYTGSSVNCCYQNQIDGYMINLE